MSIEKGAKMDNYGEYTSTEDKEFHANRRQYRRLRHDDIEAERWAQEPEKMARENFNDYRNGGYERAVAILGEAEVARLVAEAEARFQQELADDERYKRG